MAPRTIPKTSSGKIRRSDWRALYERGTTGQPRGTARQILRLLIAAGGKALRRAPRTAVRWAFGVWCWIVGIGFGLPAATITDVRCPAGEG